MRRTPTPATVAGFGVIRIAVGDVPTFVQLSGEACVLQATSDNPEWNLATQGGTITATRALLEELHRLTAPDVLERLQALLQGE